MVVIDILKHQIIILLGICSTYAYHTQFQFKEIYENLTDYHYPNIQTDGSFTTLIICGQKGNISIYKSNQTAVEFNYRFNFQNGTFCKLTSDGQKLFIYSKYTQKSMQLYRKSNNSIYAVQSFNQTNDHTNYLNYTAFGIGINELQSYLVGITSNNILFICHITNPTLYQNQIIYLNQTFTKIQIVNSKILVYYSYKLCLYNYNGTQLIKQFQLSINSIGSAVLSSDLKYLIVGILSKEIKVYKLNENNGYSQIQTLLQNNYQSCVLSLSNNSEYLGVACSTKIIIYHRIGDQFFQEYTYSNLINFFNLEDVKITSSFLAVLSRQYGSDNYFQGVNQKIFSVLNIYFICLRGCKECLEISNCLTCEDGFMFQSQSCVQCMEGCTKCNSTSLCLRCRDDYTLTQEGKCKKKLTSLVIIISIVSFVGIILFVVIVGFYIYKQFIKYKREFRGVNPLSNVDMSV